MGRDVVIRAEGLSKKYIIGHQGGRESYVALRDVIARNARNLWRTTADILKGRPSIEGDELEEFWALRDINFEIERGEVVGVIGRNGAGKSTLLKVLSRITEPTEGKVEIRGRVASLLEVGTGFHPELTGRENIYLNGAILGMTHAEIRRKFDEIVAFAEVERFLDTPVKRYSSGMYVRLAFAVAAHLEPEILIVDEVLAVGDAEFQKKCLGKMGEVASEGRTVLFVSHNMGAVQRLCHRVLVLVDGTLSLDSESVVAIGQYCGGEATRTYSAPRSPTVATITSASAYVDGPSIRLSIEYYSPFPLVPPIAGFIVYDPAGTPVFGSTTRQGGPCNVPKSATEGRFDVTIPVETLRTNLYSISLWLSDYRTDHCNLERIIHVNVDGTEPELPYHLVGSVCLPVTWRYE